MRIVTHTNPDLDCITAVWMLKRFAGAASARVSFLRIGAPVPPGLRKALFVDIGRGELDHHQREDQVCAATLVLEKYSLQADSALTTIAEVARNVDHGLPEVRVAGSMSLTAVISGLNEKYPNDPARVLRLVSEYLDAIYAGLSLESSLAESFSEGIRFSSRWGPGFAAETTQVRALRRYAHAHGIVLFVYLDPKTRFRGLVASGGRNVDLSAAFAKLKEMEPRAEWYLHLTKDLLICGSRKARSRQLSRLSLEQLVAVARRP
jgi:hypothetical protein